MGNRGFFKIPQVTKPEEIYRIDTYNSVDGISFSYSKLVNSFSNDEDLYVTIISEYQEDDYIGGLRIKYMVRNKSEITESLKNMLIKELYKELSKKFKREEEKLLYNKKAMINFNKYLREEKLERIMRKI
jgi:hypothetical protein